MSTGAKTGSSSASCLPILIGCRCVGPKRRSASRPCRAISRCSTVCGPWRASGLNHAGAGAWRNVHGAGSATASAGWHHPGLGGGKVGARSDRPRGRGASRAAAPEWTPPAGVCDASRNPIVSGLVPRITRATRGHEWRGHCRSPPSQPLCNADRTAWFWRSSHGTRPYMVTCRAETCSATHVDRCPPTSAYARLARHSRVVTGALAISARNASALPYGWSGKRLAPRVKGHGEA